MIFQSSLGPLSLTHDFFLGCFLHHNRKSTFLNAATDLRANAKVGAYPFTTIEPNHGIGQYITTCPCKRLGFSAESPSAQGVAVVDPTQLTKYTCCPRFGKCLQGKRYVPVQIIDVAGLVPGASEGRGLGNKFLDDLRHAVRKPLQFFPGDPKKREVFPPVSVRPDSDIRSVDRFSTFCCILLMYLGSLLLHA